MSKRLTVKVIDEEQERVFEAEYGGGMYIDLGFAGKYPIEVITVSPHSKMRKTWDELSKGQKEGYLTKAVEKWIKYMDDPNDDGNWAGWYQDYVDASRPR